ncbi:uncharacterized protein LOC125225219 [Leguminivora glycinivorella]|uniref:uncharacterized protein LOC125225219 n=1 Tax=Leguminivora glycinivorella TaxID=1035111 RepID=UPI00200C8FC2|nr:uncharacterized protein LOC125225219 [Leguminivora glycinivorella]
MSSREGLTKRSFKYCPANKNAKQVNSCKTLGSESSEPSLTIAKVIQYPSKHEIATSSSYSGSGEYFKMYDYDMVPVKETLTSETSTESNVERSDRISLTESYLNNIERNISEELQTDCSTNTLDSSIKFFKVTVEEIFNKFYANMHDFELYKKKFHDLLSKEQGECVEEMEDFIKDMIRHIMASESSDLNADLQTKEKLVESSEDISKLVGMQSVMEAFKNENYNSMESTSDEKASENKHQSKEKVSASETLNIYLMSKNPYLKIQMNNKNSHLSEIQIMDRCNSYNQGVSKLVASADDMKMLSAKKMELAMLETLKDSPEFADREIPVKISFAKKNIPSDDETHRESSRSEKSFLGCLCSYLCKKLRKATNF